MPVNQHLLKVAARRTYEVQNNRLRDAQRIKDMVSKGVISEAEAKTLTSALSDASAQEREAEGLYEKVLYAEANKAPVFKQWLIKVKGIGPRLASLLVGDIGDISRFDNVAKLWAYCGYRVLHDVTMLDGTIHKDLHRVLNEGETTKLWTAPHETITVTTRDIEKVSGHGVRHTKGQVSNWNARLKVTCWKVGQSFIKVGGYYRSEYDTYRRYLEDRQVSRGYTIYRQEEDSGVYIPYRWPGKTPPPPPPKPIRKRPEWTAGRIHNMAIRRVVKLFLAHLWEAWRDCENLTTRPPYLAQYGDGLPTGTPSAWDILKDPDERPSKRAPRPAPDLKLKEDHGLPN